MDLIKDEPMNRPKLRMFEALDYFECIKYLEKKYNFNSRDYAGKYKRGSTPNTPYQDYWHFVIDCVDVHNGSFMWISNEWVEDLAKDDYRTIITNLIFEEFADYNKDGSIQFWVDW